MNCELIIALLAGWLLDLLLGDPSWLPHPVVGFGKWISFWEHHLNHGRWRKAKGAVFALTSIILVFVLTWLLFNTLLPVGGVGGEGELGGETAEHTWAGVAGAVLAVILIFFCLAGHTLRREVRDVFLALDRSLDDGRRQVARIVGRDTSELSAQEVRTAALETLAENLSDGVVAPLFWLALLGVPGMVAYKMVNTLDSMIGYRTDRYRDFGCWAARIDDVANYIPARLTAMLMIITFTLTSHSPLSIWRGSRGEVSPLSRGRGAGGEASFSSLIRFVHRNGRNHASPNSGYPEAALAGILDCRFGGPHYYFGQLFHKPYIGTNPRLLTTDDMRTALRVNFSAEVLMVVLTALLRSIW